MTLVSVPIEPFDGPLPPPVAHLIDEARTRIDRFVDDRSDNPLHTFVPCDFAAVYRCLAAIRDAHLASGRMFVEWGAGFGVVTSLACLLGYEAHGIEIEADLVAEAERLAADFDTHATFTHGSFIPESITELRPHGDNTWIDMGGADAFAILEIDPDEFDVVFAYPWPGEHETVDWLFEKLCARGAILITYHDVEGMRIVRRK